jgi:hypothetical protein
MKIEILESIFQKRRAASIDVIASWHIELQEYAKKHGGQIDGSIITGLSDGQTRYVQERLKRLDALIESFNAADELISALRTEIAPAGCNEVFDEAASDLRLANQYQCDSHGCVCMHKILQNVSQGRIINSVPKEAERAKSIVRLMAQQPHLF